MSQFCRPKFPAYLLRIILILTISFTGTQTLAAITGYGSFGGNTTTAPSSISNLNQDTPYSIKWTRERFDSTYFDHETSSFAHELTFKVAGNYRVSFSIPLDEVSGSNRRAIRAELYLNGNPIDVSRAESSYIRDTSGHTTASVHLSTLLSNISVNDILELKVSKETNRIGDVTTPGAQLFLQFVDPSEKVLFVKGDQTTSGTNLNNNSETPFSWDEAPITNAAFSHSTVSSSNQVTFNEAGSYRVSLNIPLQDPSACPGNNRTSVQARVKLNGSIVTSGIASQGYIRCTDDHQFASIHWSGYLHGVTSGQILSVDVIGETTVFATVNVPSGRKASLLVEQIDTSTKAISLNGTALTTGTNWNVTSGGSVQWNTQDLKDAAVYTHSTSTNSHQITFAESGDYLVTYTDALTATLARANPVVQLRLNNSLPDGGECRSHYIRNTNGHNESSCSLTYLLENVSSGDILEVAVSAGAATGTVNDLRAAEINIIQLSAQEPILDIANIPNKAIHFDMSDNANVLDNSNRNANDTSFSGDVKTAIDISGSEFPHDGVQTNTARQPTYNKVTNVLNFDGTDDFFAIANATDINTGVTSERTFAMVFRTGSDVSTRQMIYEEGGGVRGINVYVASGSIYLGFWNLNNDGDGAQAFVSTNTTVAANTNYYVTMVYDYSNYTGPAGPNGSLRGTINGTPFSFSGSTTSRLYSHPGAIGVGAMNNDTCYHTGCAGGNGDYFGGDIFEFVMYNAAISPALEIEYYNYFLLKWPDPFPVTNLDLASQYTSDATTSPTITWDASISTDIDHYEVAIGTAPDLSDVEPFSDVGNVTSTSLSGLSLSECVSYYAVVKAVDPEPKESTLESTSFFKYDGTAPSDPSGLAVSGGASATVSKVLTWSGSSDNCAFERYEVALGTTSGGNEVVNWTDVGTSLSHQFTGLSLANATDYFLSVRAVDSAGNVSGEISSTSWQLDTCVASDSTSPSDPSSLALSGVAGSNTSPTLAWTASTDGCGLSHYEIAIGTSAGASDVQGFSNIGDVTTYKYFALSPALSTNTNYFLSLKSVDLAGNESSVVSSTVWSLPAPGNVSSGLVLWLDGDDISTMYQTTDCSTTAVTTDGNPIGCWLDKSQSGNNATAAANNRRPTYQTNEFNGKAIVRLDGNNDALDFTAISDIRTVFVVNKSNTASYQPLLGHSSSTHWFTNDNSLLTSGASAFLTGGSWRVNKSNISNPLLTTQSGQYSLYSVVSTGDVAADHISSDRKNGGRFFNGDFVEVIIYDRALSEAEVINIENYLHDKWFSAAPGELDGLALSSEYTNSSTLTPTLSWNHSSAGDLSHYEIALGKTIGQNDVAGWFDIALSNSYQFSGSALDECVPHYMSVRAVDTDGFMSDPATSGPFQYDGTSPTTPNSLVLSGSASTAVSETLTWAASTDTCSSITYELSLGTSAGSNDVVDWLDVGAVSSYQFTGLSISEAVNYFINIRAKDSAGNLSGVSSSSAWQVASCVATDTTDPVPPSSLAQSGSASLKLAPSFSWGSGSDACAFSHHEVSIGTTAGSDNVVSWTNVSSATTHQFSNITPSLAYDTNYFFNVRAVDQAGNTSSNVSSSAWTLFAPGSVSATNLALWVDAENTDSLYEDDSCTTAATSNNQNVGCVLDQSGNDNHLKVNASSNKPILKFNSFNTKRSLTFDGSSNEFLNFTTRLTGIRTVFWVLREDTSNLGDTVPLLGDPDGGTTHFARASTGGAFFNNSTASASVTGGTLQVNKVVTTGTVSAVPTTESVISLVTTGGVTADSFTRDLVSCCGNRTFGGRLAELIIYERALSAVEVEAVEDYLMSKWNLVNSTTEWLGSVDTDWNTPGNWTNGVPTSSLDCVIADRANDPVIASGVANCRSLLISNGHLTLQNAGGVSLRVYDDATVQTGTITANDGEIIISDDGSTLTSHDIDFNNSSVNLTFNKSAGGTVILDGDNTFASFDMPVGSNMSFLIRKENTINFPNGLTIQGGDFVVERDVTMDIGNGSALTLSGGTFTTTGLNDGIGNPGDTPLMKVKMTSTGGRWSFVANGGVVSLTGFILDNLDVSGLQILGNANLSALDGGQFTNLVKDYSTPVRAVTLNTTATISESVAVNVGFNWDVANGGYAGDPTPSDNYYTVYAQNCGGGSLVFDQWFGDFWGAPTSFDTEDKIHDDAEGGNCSVSMDIAVSPVTITSFSATPYDQTAVVEWETGSELDHLGFNLYRSTNPIDGYVQINNELIRNYLTSGEFRGRYRFVDPDLTNDQVYYYILEDVAINGDQEQHGPVFVRPLGSLGSAPGSGASDVNTPIYDPGSSNLGGGIALLSQTNGSFRVSITPGSLQLTTATWNSSYVHAAIPGYSSMTEAGHPELLVRKVLIPVEDSYSTVQASLFSHSTTDTTAALTGKAIAPAPDFTANSDGELIPSYNPDAGAYSDTNYLPNVYYEVASSTVNILGQNYVEITVYPLRYQANGNNLERLDQLILDVGLEGNAWDYNPPSDIYQVSPSVAEGAIRIKYSEEGMYEVSYAQLVAINAEGFYDGIDVDDLRLYYHDKEIPLKVNSGDSVFGTGDSVIFYGPFSESHHDKLEEVVLSFYDFDVSDSLSDDARRIEQVSIGSSDFSAIDDTQLKTITIRDNNYAVFDVPVGLFSDHLFLKRIFTANGTGVNANSSYSTSVDLSDISPYTDFVRATILLSGRGVLSENPTHHLQLEVGSTVIDSEIFKAPGPTAIIFDIPIADISAGSNTFKFTVLGDQVKPGDFDMVDIEEVSITYELSNVRTSNHSLFVGGQANEKFVSTNHQSANVEVYDVSDNYDIFEYGDVFVDTFDGGSNYQVSFKNLLGNTGNGGLRKIIVEDSNYKSAASVQLSSGVQSILKNSQNEFEFIIICESHVVEVAQRLADYRTSQGLETLVASFDQIYGEFSHGRKDPTAIQKLVAFSRENWSQPLSYVFIIGDASYDPKDDLGWTGSEMQPLLLYPGSQNDYGSDSALGLVELGNDEEETTPSVAVGRLPTNSLFHIESYIQKVIDYESGVRSPVDFAKKSAFIAGSSDENEDFSKGAQTLIQTYLSSNKEFASSFIDRNTINDAQTKTELISAINEGPLMVTYLGHGAEDLWGLNGFFDTSDAQALTNTRLPIMMGLGCLNSYFYDPDTSWTSLAEELVLNPDGGAIAFFGSTTLTSPQSQMKLATSALNEFGRRSKTHQVNTRIGEWMVTSSNVMGSNTVERDMVLSWALFGDPTLRLPREAYSEPEPAPSVTVVESSSGGGGCSAFAAGRGPSASDPWSWLLFALELFSYMGLYRLRRVIKVKQR